MASDKFGSNPVAPLYNATGRNPRDLEMGSIGKGLGSVGSSGAGGKDFGIANRPAQTQPLGQGMLSPFHTWGPNSMYQSTMGRNRRFTNFGPGKRRRGGLTNDYSGDSGDPEGTVYDAEGRRVAVDAMERTKPNVTVNFADQIGLDDNSVGKNATVEEGGQISGRDSAGRDMLKNNKFTQNATLNDSESAPQTGKTPRTPRTEEQKEATKSLRQQKAAANPNYGKRNLNRPPKEASPIARQRSAKPAPIQGSRITQTMSIGDMKKMPAPGM